MGHVPGALPLPEDDFDRAFATLEDRLRSHFDIIVYCSGYGCEASHIVARKLAGKRHPRGHPPRGLARVDGRRIPRQGRAAAVTWLRHPVLHRAAGIVLGAVFLYASLDKIAQPGEFARIIYHYQVIGPSARLGYVPANLLGGGAALDGGRGRGAPHRGRLAPGGGGRRRDAAGDVHGRGGLGALPGHRHRELRLLHGGGGGPGRRSAGSCSWATPPFWRWRAAGGC